MTEFLLWKTRASTVNDRAEELIDRLDTPVWVVEREDRESLKEGLRPFGLYNRRSRLILETSRSLMDKHEGRVPRSEEALLELPGVGQYIARATLVTAFEEPFLPVDPNVEKVLSECFAVAISNPRHLSPEERDELRAIVADHPPFKVLWAFIDYGALVLAER